MAARPGRVTAPRPAPPSDPPPTTRGGAPPGRPDPTMTEELPMRALATWCVRHRRVVVLLWLGALVVTTLLARSVGSRYSSSISLPHTESTQAVQLLQAASPKVSGDTEQVVVGTSGGRKVTDPAVISRVRAMLAREARLPHVSAVASPYDPGAGHRISRSKTVAFATVTFDRPARLISARVGRALVETARSADAPGITVAVEGHLAGNTQNQSLGSVGLGIVLAGVVLFVAFGSLFAVLLPLVSALASLGTAVGIIGLLSHVMEMPDFATELVLLIGLGVGIDYALFIVTRHRQGLMVGSGTEDSIVTAVNTSGRAVLFAGIIVCIALLGMFALGVTFLTGMAAAAAIGVLFTMVATLTLVPALLSFIGPHVLSRRQRERLRDQGPRRPGTLGAWARWASVVARRPSMSALASVALVVVVALPIFALRLGTADSGSDPAGSTTRQAYDLLAKGFGPGFNGPLELVAVVADPAQRTALARVEAAVGRVPGVASVAPLSLMPSAGGRQVAVLEVYPTTSPQAAATTDLIQRLRSSTIPRAVGTGGPLIYVGGSTAVSADFASVLSSKLPLFVGIVILLSFLLLAVVFRSLLIPLTAAVMNLLSAGAAFGVLVAVFQWGWLGSVLGVDRAGPVEPFLPVMLLSILFGLSMDYEVFLVTRIHEEWQVSGDNRAAVRRGLAATGKTITAAAVIMILVFASFVLGDSRVIKEFGLGLAAGIVMDAIVIRSGLVPAAMLLLGRANWWFPRWLDRALPRISVDIPEEDLLDPPDVVAEVDALSG